MDLYEAIRARRERACEVRETYCIEYAGSLGWVVMHEQEPERCYFVDMISRTCTCPDWHCTAQGLSIDCKHILAVDPLWRKEANITAMFMVNGRPSDSAGFVAVKDPDPDDPYKD